MVKKKDSDLITTVEAADILGVTAKTAWEWIKRGKLPGHHYGNSYLTTRASVLKFKANKDSGGKAMPTKIDSRLITRTYEMEDFDCPECQGIFSMQSDLMETMDDAICPYCGTKMELGDEEDEEEEEDKGESEAE